MGNAWHTVQRLDAPKVCIAGTKFGWETATGVKKWPKCSKLNKSI